MKIWIPTIGDRIRLLEDWTFTVTRERRNSDLIDLLAPGSGYYDWARNPNPPPPLPLMTIPAETVLRVDRIYIRGTFRDFDSVTFRIHQCPRRRELTSKKMGGTGAVMTRFFAKLTDVNQIEAEPLDA